MRQGVIALMTQKLGYPINLIAVEKSLQQLPHLEKNHRLPLRRADVLCFAKSADSLYPLLLIECKAVKLNAKVINQVVGYNHFVKARYVAVVNADEVLTGWRDSKTKSYRFIKGLPPYSELIQGASVLSERME